MEQNESIKNEIVKSEESAESSNKSQKDKKDSKGASIAFAAIAMLFVIVIAGSIVLAFQKPTAVAAVRDIFVILMALMLAIIGTALVILILQISNLINILKNDIKPMLESGTETVNTLKGTVQFISNNLAEPIIKFNESLASFKKVGQLFKLFKD